MTTQNSPYAAFATLLASSGQPVSPAELHGLLLGRSCAGSGFDLEPWLVDATELLGSEPQDNVRQALIGLQEMVKGELSGSEVTVVLLLPGDDAPRSSQRLQAPPTDISPLGEGATHLQARLYQTGNTWGTTQDGVTTSSQPHTQPAAETHWPLPGTNTRGGAASQAPHSLPVAFGDDSTHSQPLQASQPLPLEAGGWQLAACLQVAGVEEAAVRFANSDDASTERFLGQAIAQSGQSAVAADLRAMLLDFFRATGRREAFEQHVAAWSR